MSRKFFFLVVIISLIFSATGGVSALAGPVQPPDREPLPQEPTDEPASDMPGHRLWTGEVSGAPSAPHSSLAPSVDLGKPGLSFAYNKTFGVTESPYLADTIHLNNPSGLFTGPGDVIYVVENEGSRLLRYNALTGQNDLSIGHAGMHYTARDNFSWPNDVAEDGDGNIWVVDGGRAVQFDSDGNYLQAFPEEGEEDWIEDNDHLSSPLGIAFDTSGRMYVSDSDFHRVQVFSFDINGTPVYSATIGTAFEPGNDNQHFNYPGRIMLDSLERLYVVDTDNHRIQRCTYAPGWTCGTFHGTGTGGSNDNQLLYPQGIMVDGNYVYIVDTDNRRIKKCTLAGACTTLIGDIDVVANDVCRDSMGNLYVSVSIGAHQVLKFDYLGNGLGAFAGVEEVPYVTDTTRLNNPVGLAVDSAGNIYVSENRGYRLVKLDPNGVQLWTIGDPGIVNPHFAHPDGNLAVDASGRVYISNTNRHRVQIYNPNSSFYNAIGVLGTPGSDNLHFKGPRGVAISPLNGDIYVADRDNHRVQIFYSNLQHKYTLGQTGVPGAGSNQFNQPHGVAVDWSGNIYVADRENHRVQKFNSSYDLVDTLGVTGVCSNSLDHLCRPYSVTVDRSGRVYVSVRNRNRVEVFDANGGYLTTIGGSWGTQSGQLRNPYGVAVDAAGGVYVADSENHRVQKYIPYVMGWTQRNLNGFGERANTYIATLASFQNQLYAGTYNNNGGQLWRSSDGLNWSAVRTDGLGDPTNIIIDDLIMFGGKLYAGTGNESEDGAQILRSDNGTNWSEVTPPGLDPDTSEFMLLEVFEDKLYVNASGTGTHGTEIWRCTLCDGSDWEQVVANGLGDLDNVIVTNFTEYDGYLYSGLWNTVDGAEVWRSATGASGSWDRVATGGINDVYNTVIGGMAVFDNMLYAGTANYTDSDNPGAELWRCEICDGTDWDPVPIAKGFGDTENRTIYLVTYRNNLLAFTTNRTTGTQAWRSSDGESWRQVNLDGFGSSNNSAPYWENGIEIFNDRLYIGTVNFSNGGQIWLYWPGWLYLPLVRR